MHPDNYELAATYYLEEFAGDVGFLSKSEPNQESCLVGVMNGIVAKMLGRPIKLDDAKVFSLSEYRFFHGCASFEGRVILFFYFEEEETGIFLVMPGSKGGVDVGRFKIPDGWSDPKKN
jgi:hypothetical protein